MSTTRRFDLADILSITTGRLVSPRLMEGVYEILSFMTGEPLFTHQLPRACDVCQPALLAQHPQLAEVVLDVHRDSIAGWLADKKARFGEQLDVRALSPGAYEPMCPVEEAEELTGVRPIIVQAEKEPRH